MNFRVRRVHDFSAMLFCAPLPPGNCVVKEGAPGGAGVQKGSQWEPATVPPGQLLQPSRREIFWIRRRWIHPYMWLPLRH